MKTLPILIITLFCAISAIAQPWSGPVAGNIYYNQGNVGIGTTAPATPLHIYKTFSGIQNQLTLENIGSAIGNNGSGIFFKGYQGSNALITAYGDPQNSTGGGLQFQTYSDNTIANVGLVINRLGYVGIGTTAPSNNLNVYTTTNTGGITVTGGAGATNTSLIIKNNGSGGNSWDISSTGGGHGYGEGKLLIGLGFSPMMTINGGGNVGIGTTSPGAKLEINDGGLDIVAGRFIKTIGGHNNIEIGNTFSSGGTFALNAGITAISNGGFEIRDVNAATSRMVIQQATGNVGIGTTSPTTTLEIKGALVSNRGILTLDGTDGYPLITMYTGTTYKGNLGFIGNDLIIENYLGGTGGNIKFLSKTSGGESMRIDTNGNVGIGTTTPEAKLTVKGKIVASEIQVKADNLILPDYVFKPDYRLMSLDKVENFVKQNQHLPEVPSDKEFKKDGINVAEMNALLLKKVEELTLYAIEQNKRIVDLDKQNVKIQVLEEKIAALEKTHK